MRHLPGVDLVVAGENRWDKLKKNNPSAMSLRTYIQNRVDELTKVNDPVLSISDVDYEHRSFIRMADVSKIDDPVVVEYINLVRSSEDDPNWTRAALLTQAASNARLRVGLPERKTKNVRNPLRDYPLVGACRGERIEELYIYMNAKFAAKESK
jgi:hypothetical protein